ncbi:ZSWM8 protein, partial [Pseudoatta argentina]
FEEDSLCSFSSEPESLCNNWRGWRRLPPTFGLSKKSCEVRLDAFLSAILKILNYGNSDAFCISFTKRMSSFDREKKSANTRVDRDCIFTCAGGDVDTGLCYENDATRRLVLTQAGGIS